MRRAVLLPAVLALLGALPAPSPARADEAETERRLKRIGVEGGLREEVREAVNRGVAFLVSRQGKGGRWIDPGGLIQAGVRQGDGLNALCALALVHADTEAAGPAAAAAVEALFPGPGRAAPQLQDTVYGAGLALLLLDAVEGDPRVAGHIAAKLAAGRDPGSGSFNYRTGPAPAPVTGLQAPPRPPQLSGPLNLSTAQFAVLGLHAAARRGIGIPSVVWKDVLDGLLASQQTDGSWTYSHHDPGDRRTYPAATFMGTANLVLARHHLDALVPLRSSRVKRVDGALEEARGALESDGPLALWLQRRSAGPIDGYGLWSLEKACVFLDLERLDGLPWYAHAARTLVDRQGGDGSWEGSDGNNTLVNTAFALLVLVRDMETQRTATPRPIGTRGVATGGEAGAGGKEPRDPLGGAVPADRALETLRRFREALGERETPNGVLLEHLAVLSAARDDMAPPAAGSPPVDPGDLLEGMDGALLDALLLAGPDPAGDPEGRRTVNGAAAGVLGDASPGLLLRVRGRLDRLFADPPKGDPRTTTTPYRPALRLLALRGDGSTLEWMLKAALHDDAEGERAERSIALLEAVPAFPLLPGRVRLAAADAIATRFVGREGQGGAAPWDGSADVRPRVRWSRLRPRVMEALLHLARDPATGREPRGGRGAVPLRVKEFRDWLRDHDDPRLPPWR